jgi:anaerobic selenocysteine-containing dehydrogenase
MIADGPLLTAPMHDLPAGTHLDRYVLPEEPNGRGADALGMRPVNGGLHTRGMLEAARDGNLHLLALLGANPMLRFGDRALVEAALEATPFVVVTELFMTETAERADLILPVCSAFEKTGTTTNLAGDIVGIAASVRAPSEVIADGDAIVLLAEALGIPLPGVAEMEAAIRAGVRTPPAFGPDALPPAPAAVAAGVVRVIRETTIFTGGGTLAHDRSIAALLTVPRATLHPETARALALNADDVVSVRGERGALDGLVVAIDPRVPAGAVALVDGIATAPLNALGTAESVQLAKALVPA